MKPRWMQNHVACPECGYILKDANDGFTLGRDSRNKLIELNWNCPRCLSHWTPGDFWNEQSDKWDRTANLKDEEIP